MLKECIITLLDNYLTEKRDFNLTPSPRTLSNYVVNQQFVKMAPKLWHNYAIISRQNYKIECSIGNGNLSDIPWLAIFDKEVTTNAQEGYYIVYLFKADMSGVYLSLNQGWTQYTKKYKGIKEQRLNIYKNTRKAKMLLKSVGDFNNNELDLAAKGDLARGYTLGNICSKFYPAHNIPDDDSLIDDLRNLIGVYRELKGRVSGSILDIINLAAENFQAQAQMGSKRIFPTGKIPKKEKSISLVERWKRDRDIAYAALELANFTCEYNSDHTTFISRNSDKKFMEAHHIIPLEFQDNFDYSIDILENIACLCPTCHRAIHHGTDSIRAEYLSKFLGLRKNRLKEKGIEVTLNKLLEQYRVLDIDPLPEIR